MVWERLTEWSQADGMEDGLPATRTRAPAPQIPAAAVRPGKAAPPACRAHRPCPTVSPQRVASAPRKRGLRAEGPTAQPTYLPLSLGPLAGDSAHEKREREEENASWRRRWRRMTGRERRKGREGRGQGRPALCRMAPRSPEKETSPSASVERGVLFPDCFGLCSDRPALLSPVPGAPVHPHPLTLAVSANVALPCALCPQGSLER